MRTYIISILLFLFSSNVFSQNILDFDNLISKLDTINFPFTIDEFSDFSFNLDSNSIFNYNDIVIENTGYLNHKNELKKATRIYDYTSLRRMHQKMADNKYVDYAKVDSIELSFVGLINFSTDYIVLLVKIKEVPNDFQLAYRYKLLSFNTNGDHVSTIDVFEQIDDSSTIDWLTEKASPNITSNFNSNFTFDVIWDEGYNDIYIQKVFINNEGVFSVKELYKK